MSTSVHIHSAQTKGPQHKLKGDGPGQFIALQTFNELKVILWQWRVQDFPEGTLTPKVDVLTYYFTHF